MAGLFPPATDGVVLKDLAGAAPGEAESFQWVNLMRGDTMLMSLTNHRYLATKPNSPGPVTASAAGPRPDRKDGACFTWREVAPSQPAPPAKETKAANRSPEKVSSRRPRASSISVALEGCVAAAHASRRTCTPDTPH